MSKLSDARVIIVGTGRMGSVIQELLAEKGAKLVALFDVDTVSELDEAAPFADLLIDFSAPSALPHIAAYVKRTGAALVSGTTGFSEEELDQIKNLGECAPVIHSANYSLGVAVLRKLATITAEALPTFDIELVETHHKHKVDAPSGTAKALLEAVNAAGEKKMVYGREGIPGERDAREIGVHALRGGSVAGVHELHFFGDDEELSLVHRATSRRIFAAGALAAAERLMGRDPGFVSFDELMFARTAC